MRIIVTEGLAEVGDIIFTHHRLGGSSFPVTRVTKTLAISKRESDGYERKFKRGISYDMRHPYEQWNTTPDTVTREIEDKIGE